VLYHIFFEEYNMLFVIIEICTNFIFTIILLLLIFVLIFSYYWDLYRLSSWNIRTRKSWTIWSWNWCKRET